MVGVDVGGTRLKGRSRRITLGRHGVVSADQARHKAAETIALIKSGQDLDEKRASEITVAELTERYIEEHVEVHCKPSTQKMYRSVLKRVILPAAGHRTVDEVERQHIAKLHLELRDTLSSQPGTGHRNQAVQPRRGMEAAHGCQPVQVRSQVPGAQAGAVSHLGTGRRQHRGRHPRCARRGA